MTQEQRDLLQKELSDFMNRKCAKMREDRLMLSAIPFDTVKLWYDDYKTVGNLTIIAEKLNMSSGTLKKHFRRYGLKSELKKKPRSPFHKKRGLTQLHLDTLNMRVSEWCKKYDKFPSSYYRTKKGIEKYLEEQGSVDS
jgi:hypothetical protein